MPHNCKLLPDKGYERLERYEGKLSRTVLRRGRASNRSSLFGDMLPETGRNSARKDDGIAGMGNSKKRMTFCNEMYRGSKFALTRKGADLLKVFHCMNGGKPMNVRYSTTLKSERLTDAQCVNRLQTRITKAVIEM